MTWMICGNWTRTPMIRLIACGLLAAALSVLTGCEEEGLDAYEAPKSQPYVEPELFTRMRTPQPAPSAIEWDVPEGWAESPNASTILFAVFEAKAEAGDARITVTKLSTDGGGVLANINRWRGQVGLPAIQKIEEQSMTPILVGTSTAGLIDLITPEGSEAGLERLMVVLLPRPHDGLTWYFKMTGSVAAMDEQQSAFVSFVESVRFVEVAGVEAEAGAEKEADAESGTESTETAGGDAGE